MIENLEIEGSHDPEGGAIAPPASVKLYRIYNSGTIKIKFLMCIGIDD